MITGRNTWTDIEPEVIGRARPAHEQICTAVFIEIARDHVENWNTNWKTLCCFVSSICLAFIKPQKAAEVRADIFNGGDHILNSVTIEIGHSGCIDGLSHV